MIPCFTRCRCIPMTKVGTIWTQDLRQIFIGLGCWLDVFNFFFQFWDLRQLILFFPLYLFIYFLEIQCLGLSLIGCLITKKNLCIGTEHLLAKILVSSLQRFKDMAEVQIKVCALSWREFGILQIFLFQSILNNSHFALMEIF